MADNYEKSKRIVKNTGVLYVRMLFTVIIGLVTSRIVLKALGVEDYGTHNVVAGVVTMFSLFTSSLSVAISRFITYELGKKDVTKMREIFSTSVNVLIVMSVVIVFLSEVVGVWFIENKLNIPAGRMAAAHWVFQCSMVTFLINFMSVPFTATIMAYERMTVYAYITILDVALKLVVAVIIYTSACDRLELYALLLVIVSLIVCSVYLLYCRYYFSECRYKMVYNKTLLKQMSGFASWNLFGTGAYLFNTQGVNIITNIFFGVGVNAARGVVSQVEGVVKQFVANFTTAINPQIVKSYAEGNNDYMFTLVCRGAKYAYFLMLLIIVPFVVECEQILTLWLGNVPAHTVVFLRLALLGTIIDLLGHSTANAAWATGKVKRYYLFVGSVGCLVFPISYVLFSIGMPAYVSYIVFAIIYLILVFVKLYIIRGLLNFPVAKFYKEVLARILPVTLLAVIFPLGICHIMEVSICRLLLVVLASSVSIVGAIYFIGLETTERQFVMSKIKRCKIR